MNKERFEKILNMHKDHEDAEIFAILEKANLMFDENSDPLYFHTDVKLALAYLLLNRGHPKEKIKKSLQKGMTLGSHSVDLDRFDDIQYILGY